MLILGPKFGGYLGVLVVPRSTSRGKQMASTADAWLIYLPGMTRKHEVFTAEQLIQDMENLDDLVYSTEDHQDVSQDGSEPHPLSLLCLFSGTTIDSRASKRLDFPPLLYSRLAKKANARVLHSRPLLVQTRAQGGTLSAVARSPEHKRKLKIRTPVKDVVAGKQRQSPLSSWIGKELLRTEDTQEVCGQGWQITFR